MMMKITEMVQYLDHDNKIKWKVIVEGCMIDGWMTWGSGHLKATKTFDNKPENYNVGSVIEL